MSDPPANIRPSPDGGEFGQDLLAFARDMETTDRLMGEAQETLDGILEATADSPAAPLVRRELRVLVPPLESLQRRLRVFNAAIERFLREVP